MNIKKQSHWGVCVKTKKKTPVLESHSHKVSDLRPVIFTKFFNNSFFTGHIWATASKYRVVSTLSSKLELVSRVSTSAYPQQLQIFGYIQKNADIFHIGWKTIVSFIYFVNALFYFVKSAGQKKIYILLHEHVNYTFEPNETFFSILISSFVVNSEA